MNQQSQTDQNHLQLAVINFRQPVFIKRWCFYCSRRGRLTDSNVQYSKNLELIATIKSIEQFFGYYLSFKKPSQHDVDSKVMLFGQKYRPLWEDWSESGCLILSFKNNNEIQMHAVNQIWEYLSFMMVGNRLDHDVIGIQLNKRQKLTLIQIWLRTEHKKNQIGTTVDEMIRADLPYVLKSLKGEIKMKYKQHKISMNSINDQRSSQFDFESAPMQQFYMKQINFSFDFYAIWITVIL